MKKNLLNVKKIILLKTSNRKNEAVHDRITRLGLKSANLV